MTEIHIFDEKTSAAVRTLLDEIDQQRARAEAAEAERDDYREARDVLRHQLNTEKTLTKHLHEQLANTRQALRNLAHAYVDATGHTPPPVPGSPRRAQEDCPICAGSGDEWIGDTMTGERCPRCFPSSRILADQTGPRRAQETELPAWVLDLVRGLEQYELEHPTLYRYVGRPGRYEPWDCPAPLLALVPAEVRRPPVDEQIRGEHGPELPAEQLPVSSVIAVPSRYARAAGAPHGQNDTRDWVRLRTGSGRQYEGHRAASCPGDGVAGHVHDVRCVDRAEG